jgi:CheY-like chemotaxis protein
MAQILIGEDDPLQARIIQMITESLGHAVRVAKDGKTALAMVTVECPDLVLLDVNRPGMVGYAVCQKLKAQSEVQRAPVVMLTASPDPALNRLAFAAGASACVPKPANTQNIANILNLLLKGSAVLVPPTLAPLRRPLA